MNAITRVYPVPVTDDGLHVYDYDERIYLTRRRSSSSWHVIRPLTEHDYRWSPETAGELCCSCPGYLRHGTCWALATVAAYEAQVEQMLRWVPELEPVPATVPA